MGWMTCFCHQTCSIIVAAAGTCDHGMHLERIYGYTFMHVGDAYIACSFNAMWPAGFLGPPASRGYDCCVCRCGA